MRQPRAWDALKARGNALQATARVNREHFQRITDTMRASEQEALEEAYIEALHEEESELWPSL